MVGPFSKLGGMGLRGGINVGSLRVVCVCGTCDCFGYWRVCILGDASCHSSLFFSLNSTYAVPKDGILHALRSSSRSFLV